VASVGSAIGVLKSAGSATARELENAERYISTHVPSSVRKLGASMESEITQATNAVEKDAKKVVTFVEEHIPEDIRALATTVESDITKGVHYVEKMAPKVLRKVEGEIEKDYKLLKRDAAGLASSINKDVKTVVPYF
jgi:phosphoribosylanthranilate isomerase